MATLLDATGLGDILSLIFVFLFVFAVIYAVLKKAPFFGDNAGLNSIIAFIFAAFSVMIPESTIVIGTFLPWFFMFFLLVVLLFMFFMFLGVKNEDMMEAAKNDTVMTIILLVVITLFLISLTQAYGPFLMVNGGTGFWATTKRLIFSRKFLGIIFMFVIASFTIGFLGNKQK